MPAGNLFKILNSVLLTFESNHHLQQKDEYETPQRLMSLIEMNADQIC